MTALPIPEPRCPKTPPDLSPDVADELLTALGDERYRGALDGLPASTETRVIASATDAYGLRLPSAPSGARPEAAPAADLGNRETIDADRTNTQVRESRERFTLALKALTPEIRDCLLPLPSAGQVWIVSGSREKRSFGGLRRCGRRLCPLCASRIAGAKSAEIEKTASAHLAAGGSVALVTLTMRHSIGMPLQDCLDAALTGWRDTTGGSRRWNATREEIACQSFVRATESTYGCNGWHVHIHALLMLDAPSAAARKLLEPVVDEMFERWSSSLVKSGFPAPSRERGIDLLVGEGGAGGQVVAAYVAKAQDGGVSYGRKSGKRGKRLAWEVGYGAAGKTPKRGGRTPFMLASDGLDGDRQAVALWREYADATAGRRLFEWSRKSKRFEDLRDRYGTRDCRSDAEMAAEQQVEGGEIIAGIDLKVWSHIRRKRQHMVDALLRCKTFEDVAAVLDSDVYTRRFDAIPPPDI
ncbi:MAG: protein rep [Actinomycetia bacterium]|nr:protein rep [Actinomycetes bacterium]